MPELIELIDRTWDTLLRRPGLVLAGVTAATTATDVVTKALAVALLRDGQCVPPNSRTVAVCLVHSPGVASAPTTGVIYALVVAAILVAIAVWGARRLTSPTRSVALGLLAGGLAGNLVDRLVRAPFPGRVVDVLSIGLDVNVADLAIAAGLAALALLLLVGRRIDAMLLAYDETAPREGLDPDDEKVALIGRPKYPARKWEPMPGTARHLAAPGSGGSADVGGVADEDVVGEDMVDEDDRAPSTRPRYPAAKWDRP